MKKFFLFVLLVALLLSMCACTTVPVKGSAIIDSEGVVKITISHLPEWTAMQRVYTDPEKISKITTYIDNLALTKVVNPEALMGGVWIITYTYADGTQLVISHECHTYLHIIDGASSYVYDMVYEEAEAFYNLIYNIPSD